VCARHANFYLAGERKARLPPVTNNRNVKNVLHAAHDHPRGCPPRCIVPHYYFPSFAYACGICNYDKRQTYMRACLLNGGPTNRCSAVAALAGALLGRQDCQLRIDRWIFFENVLSSPRSLPLPFHAREMSRKPLGDPSCDREAARADCLSRRNDVREIKTLVSSCFLLRFFAHASKHRDLAV